MAAERLDGHPGWGKAYRAEGITVYFDSARCIHAAECVRGLPEVFEQGRRPWILADRARPEVIAEVVRQCPSGALHAELTDGEAEVPNSLTVIHPLRDGPLLVRGDVMVVTPAGPLRETRALLCRCGSSGNKPFCDGSHLRTGWRENDGKTHQP